MLRIPLIPRPFFFFSSFRSFDARVKTGRRAATLNNEEIKMKNKYGPAGILDNSREQEIRDYWLGYSYRGEKIVPNYYTTIFPSLSSFLLLQVLTSINTMNYNCYSRVSCILCAQTFNEVMKYSFLLLVTPFTFLH